ncbi:hypothetical protein ACN6AT_37995 (plasmid) [Streptomyces sp. JL4002]|uniref:Uncharacterized protein n=1 Tax=Streptomyces liliifuscus TaxID=2797636 RepID=A0A7T7L6G4_9ACTN|nr:hypothetical protein [Streptomyces liliifuscus]QQM47358.1 hypothetical protein JEQ17_48115 [Streptomyces liliifuscus]
MSTPAPEPDPFDPQDFPADLVAAQRQVADLYAALRAHQAMLPWSREPHPGWPDEPERGRERGGRPASPGWTPDEAAEFDRLMEQLRAATARVQCHTWWERCKQEGIKGADMVVTRQALKHAKGAVPEGTLLEQDDVRPAA